MKTVYTKWINIFIGTKPGDGEPFGIDAVKDICQSYVDKVGLCVTCTPTNFIYTNGNEPGAIVGLINYPRFPSEPGELLDHAFILGKILGAKLRQKRLSIMTAENTYMLEAHDFDAFADDDDDEVEGRWIEAVSCYASTCDGCAELTMHEDMTMDHETQLGYCDKCRKEKAESAE